LSFQYVLKIKPVVLLNRNLLTFSDFPAMIPLWAIPIATVTGNCLLLKPSERTPGAAMLLPELARDAGLPAGVLNVIHGTHDTVNFILDEPQIKAISFVGSNRAGEYIFNLGSANGKRVQANLGAKNHAVLMPNASFDDALKGLVGAAFGAAGQRCMALSVLVNVGGTERYLGKLVEMAKSLKVGNGFDPDVDIGPVVSRQSRERIENIIETAEREGGTILLDGLGVSPVGYANGNWVRHVQSQSLYR
jgi:malonate-semialdehyde dehydrogenase (acetylating)/methylmalonate-semialdehyde dehydrogenase